MSTDASTTVEGDVVGGGTITGGPDGTAGLPTAAEAAADVVESSPDYESGPLSDNQKHVAVSGGGEAAGESGTEGTGSESASGAGESDTFETGSGWEPVPASESDGEESLREAGFAETDSEEFLQFLAPLVGPLLSTVLPAALPERRRLLLAELFADPQRAYADIARHCAVPVGSIGPTRRRILHGLRRSLAGR